MILGDTAWGVICMAWGIAWLAALVFSWNDWGYIAWVALTVAPFLIDW